MPVNRDGLISGADSASLYGFNELLAREFPCNLLQGSNVTVNVSSERGRDFRAENMTDGDFDTYWSVPDGTGAAYAEFVFGVPERLDKMVLQEYIPLGQRVVDFDVEYLSDGKWLPLDCGEETSTIGYKRILRFAPVTADGVRVIFKESRGPVCVSAVEAFLRH